MGSQADSETGVHGHLPALDGLRGVAILMVLFFHTTLVGNDSPLEALLHGSFRNFGWAGVDLFFVLSGFLITGVLLDARGAPGYFRNFYARRVLRIFPVYYGYLLLLLVAAPRLVPALSSWVTAGDDALWYWLYLQNFAIAAAGDWTHSRFLNLFWSLAIEEQFYLLWPVVVLAAGRRGLVRICAALVIASLALRVALVAAGTAPVAIYVLTPARLDGLAVGALLAAAARGERGLAPGIGPARRIAGASALALVALVVWQRGFSYMLPGTATVGLTLLALLFGAVLVLAVEAGERDGLGRLLRSRLLRLYGRYSYALYVLHQAVFAVTTGLLVSRVFEPHLAPGVGHRLALQLCVYVAAIGGSTVLAAASWRYFEAPILRLKRFFPRSPAA